MIINSWAIANHEFRAKKRVITKNDMFLAEILLFFHEFMMKSDHRFMAKNAVSLGIRQNKFFFLNLSIFVALTYDQSDHKFMGNSCR